MTFEAIVGLRHKIAGLPTWEIKEITNPTTNKNKKKTSNDTDQVAYAAHCVHV